MRYTLFSTTMPGVLTTPGPKLLLSMKVKIQTDKDEIKREGRNILRDTLIGCAVLIILFILKTF